MSANKVGTPTTDDNADQPHAGSQNEGVNTTIVENKGVKVTRQRTRRVETPGTDEVKPAAKTLQDATVEVIPGPKTTPDTIDDIAEEHQKGNVAVHRRREPQIGDTWAGMTLTQHGWIKQ